MINIGRIHPSNCSGFKTIRSAGITPRGIMATVLLLLVTGNAFSQDWTQTGAPTNEWKTIATSASGSKLVAAADGVSLIHASTNAGTNWSATSAPQKVWFALASSADGTTLLAVGSDYLYITNGPFSISLVLTFARIFTSTNSGAHWTQAGGTPIDVTWTSAAASADGRKLVVGATSGAIYTSTNAGSTWILRGAPKKQWNSIASSADGERLVAVAVRGASTHRPIQEPPGCQPVRPTTFGGRRSPLPRMGANWWRRLKHSTHYGQVAAPFTSLRMQGRIG